MSLWRSGPSVSRSIRLVLSVLWYPGGVIADVTAFGWILSRCELHASTGMYGCDGCVDGWTLGAYVYSSPWRAWQVYGSQDASGFCTHCTSESARSLQFGGGIAGGADFEWIPRGVLLSCTPFARSLG